MKNSILAICLLLGVWSLQAQSEHPFELKVNAFHFLDSKTEIAAEYLLSPRVGIEAGIGFRSENSSSYFIDSLINGPAIESRELNYYVSTRYYSNPKDIGTGFFVGGMLHFYHYAKYQVQGEDVAPPQKDKFSIGAEPGFKWLLWKRAVLELSSTWLANLEKVETPYDSFTRVNYDLLINGRIGFRF